MLPILSYIIIYSFAVTIPVSTKKCIQKEMETCYELEDDVMSFEVNYPSNGWGAIGIHTIDQSEGIKSFKFCVDDDQVYIEDQTTPRALCDENTYHSIISNISGFEEQNKTTIQFSIQRNAIDEFNYKLGKGDEYYLLMAFSKSDDFNYHSSWSSIESIRF